jgi:integrase
VDAPTAGATLGESEAGSPVTVVSLPARGRPPQAAARRAGLDADQVEALAEAIDARYGTLIRFAAYSGLRSELTALRIGRARDPEALVCSPRRWVARCARIRGSRASSSRRSVRPGCPRRCGCTTCATPARRY